MIKKDGFKFAFDESACESCEGNCCIGESGYIWVSPDESLKIAEFLKEDFALFVQKYLMKVGYRYSIKERAYKDGFACVFFDSEKGCKIYDYRPNQCRTFPFWQHFKNNIEEVKKECPGIKKL